MPNKPNNVVPFAQPRRNTPEHPSELKDEIVHEVFCLLCKFRKIAVWKQSRDGEFEGALDEFEDISEKYLIMRKEEIEEDGENVKR